MVPCGPQNAEYIILWCGPLTDERDIYLFVCLWPVNSLKLMYMGVIHAGGNCNSLQFSTRDPFTAIDGCTLYGQQTYS